MILINRAQRDELEKVGLLQFKKVGYNAKEQNFTVVNKEHKGRNKHYYVVETPEILLFLEKYENANLQKLRPNQLKILIDEGLVEEKNIQHHGEYKPAATVFIDVDGLIRCKKITSYMFKLGIWKDKKDSKKK